MARRLVEKRYASDKKTMMPSKPANRDMRSFAIGSKVLARENPVYCSRSCQGNRLRAFIAITASDRRVNLPGRHGDSRTGFQNRRRLLPASIAFALFRWQREKPCRQAISLPVHT